MRSVMLVTSVKPHDTFPAAVCMCVTHIQKLNEYLEIHCTNYKDSIALRVWLNVQFKRISIYTF